jgi:hypothetical protein
MPEVVSAGAGIGRRRHTLPYRGAIADFDGNGWPDLAMVKYPIEYCLVAVELRLRNIGGSFVLNVNSAMANTTISHVCMNPGNCHVGTVLRSPKTRQKPCSNGGGRGHVDAEMGRWRCHKRGSFALFRPASFMATSELTTNLRRSARMFIYRITPKIVTGRAFLIGLLGFLPGQSQGPPQKFNPPKTYYLALGDSITYDYQAFKAAAGLPLGGLNTGFVDVFGAHLREIRPGITTINYGCPGGSTDSFDKGDYPWTKAGYPLHDSLSGSQLQGALTFLKAHRDEVSPITLLFSNDQPKLLDPCRINVQLDLTCILDSAPAFIAGFIQRHSDILDQLHSAAPDAEIIVTGVWDPYLEFLPITGVSGITRFVSELGEERVPELRLASHQRQLHIDFVSLGFGTGRPPYQYRLLGADSKEWSLPFDQRELELASLAPGQYCLALRTIDVDVLISAVPATVALRIATPIWQQTWFLVAAAVLTGTALVGLHNTGLHVSWRLSACALGLRPTSTMTSLQRCLRFPC